MISVTQVDGVHTKLHVLHVASCWAWHLVVGVSLMVQTVLLLVVVVDWQWRW